MNKDRATLDREYFEKLSSYLFAMQKPKEHLFVGLYSECSQFIRLNSAKVRQMGSVDDAILEITMIYESVPGSLHKAVRSISLCGLSYEDQTRIRDAIEVLRREVVELPVDPYAQLPKGNQVSTSEKQGKLLKVDQATSEILDPLNHNDTGNCDLAGIYAAGPIVRAMASSSGQRHWFLTENFSLNYSLYTGSQRALKETFAGTDWNREKFQKQIQAAQEKLKVLEKDPVKVPRGDHRCYLAPEAVAELIHMLSWGCISEASIRQGDSPLRKIRSGEKNFSPHFNLSEDFRAGEIPRFNSEGELSAEHLPLIENGKFVNALVSARTAKEYGATSNQAETSEVLRAPSVSSGNLGEKEVLQKLGTGLYLSNLHYLNWSDQQGGRITGMTRYACFWVENGKIMAPIENMRFDDSLFNLFGDSVEDLTQTRVYVPEVGSYSMRHIGGIWSPGILVSKMTFTL